MDLDDRTFFAFTMSLEFRNLASKSGKQISFSQAE